MKPEEFIKKFGWSGFLIACNQRPINRYKYTIIWSDEIGFSNEINERDKQWTFESKEVLRLVKSWKLVEKLGGIESASKAALKENERGHIINEGLILSSIRDVKACQ